MLLGFVGRIIFLATINLELTATVQCIVSAYRVRAVTSAVFWTFLISSEKIYRAAHLCVIAGP
jgi:hypothetical protein